MIWSLNQNIKEAEKEVHFLKSVLSQLQSRRKYLQFMYLTKGLNLKICKEFQQTNKIKVNNLMGKNPECCKSMQMTIYEKMFNFIVHQRKTNSNHSLILLHDTRMIQTRKIGNANLHGV